MAIRRIVLVSSLLVATAAAQRTWIVSAGGGPGVDFTDIPPAVAAAADGDIIVVRPGSYAAVHLAGKGLSVIGQTGVRVANASVSGLGAGQRAVITDVEVVGPLAFVPLPGARDIAGSVLFERVLFSSTIATPTIANAADVRISVSQSQRTLSIVGSTVTITDTRMVVDPSGTGPALAIHDSTVVLSRCQVVGQNELLRVFPTPAIAMTGASTLAATDDGMNVIAAGHATTVQQPSAVVGVGSFVRDPRVRVLAGSAPPVAGPIETVRAIATLSARGASPGPNVEVDLLGPGGEIFVLVLGLPGPPIPLPQLGGSVGLGSSVLGVVAHGVFTSAPFHLSLPASPGLPLGFTVAWQAIAGDTRGGWQLSNVATYARTR